MQISSSLALRYKQKLGMSVFGGGEGGRLWALFSLIQSVFACQLNSSFLALLHGMQSQLSTVRVLFFIVQCFKSWIVAINQLSMVRKEQINLGDKLKYVNSLTLLRFR